MNAIWKPLVVVAALLAGGLFAASANATTITYDFTVTIPSDQGPLGGTVSHGTFSYDSSSVTPGAENDAADLLTSLDFTWNGTTYDASIANTEGLAFDATGQLTFFEIGNACAAGTCGVEEGNETWFAEPGFFNYSIAAFAGEWFGNVTFATATASVPEPAALGMFGFGVLLIGAFVGLRRRAA